MVAGWWPCCCDGGAGNTCVCPGNVDLTVSGATAQQCTVADINTSFNSVAIVGNSGTDSYIGSYTCSTTAASNTAGWFPAKRYDHDSSSCITLSGANGAAMFLDSSGYIWLKIDVQWSRIEGFATRLWFYRDYFKSTNVLSSYSVGDTVSFTHEATVKDGSFGGSYPDPGISNMPFDASTATVSMVFNGCCYLCDDSTPEEIQVVIAGVTDDFGCSNCSQFNGTYVLPWTDTCEWELCTTLSPNPTCSFSTAQSALITLTNSILFGTLTTEVAIRIYTSSNCSSGLIATQTFQNTTSSSRTDCEYVSESVSNFGSTTFCDWSSATCTLTAL